MLTTETVLEESENSKPRICGGSRRKVGPDNNLLNSKESQEQTKPSLLKY